MHETPIIPIIPVIICSIHLIVAADIKQYNLFIVDDEIKYDSIIHGDRD